MALALLPILSGRDGSSRSVVNPKLGLKLSVKVFPRFAQSLTAPKVFFLVRYYLGAELRVMSEPDPYKLRFKVRVSHPP
jgi:hypothetical protein